MAHLSIDDATAFRMHGHFVAAGLGAPQMCYEAPVGGGPDWIGYELLGDHARSNASFLVDAGLVTWSELDPETFAARARAEITGQQGVLRCIPTIGAWARVPTEHR
jgi:hypothetical protein